MYIKDLCSLDLLHLGNLLIKMYYTSYFKLNRIILYIVNYIQL